VCAARRGGSSRARAFFSFFSPPSSLSFFSCGRGAEKRGAADASARQRALRTQRTQPPRGAAAKRRRAPRRCSRPRVYVRARAFFSFLARFSASSSIARGGERGLARALI
jgi:hypothetical protein